MPMWQKERKQWHITCIMPATNAGELAERGVNAMSAFAMHEDTQEREDGQSASVGGFALLAKKH